MNIQNFLHYHLSTDSRRDEIITFISKLDKDNQTKLLNREIKSFFKNRLTFYITWLTKHTSQSSREIADSIYSDLLERS